MEFGSGNTSKLLKIFFRSCSAFLDDAMSKESKEIYEFGEYRLDVREHRLDRIDGVTNGSLSEKPFQTLLYLVRNSGRLVTKDELLDSVWPDAIVEENNLDKAVHAIRNALGEKRGEQTYIETIRKHGYRFVSDVRFVKPIDRASEIQDPKETASFNKLPYVILAFGVLAAIVVGLITMTPWNRTAQTSKSLFILPFEKIGPGERDELLELGMADGIINRLASAQGLVIRSLRSTRDQAGSTVQPIEAGKQQKVDYVLDSNYQIADGKLRITSQLIDVASGAVEDSFKSDFELRSMFGTQDAVATEMANRILRSLNMRSAGTPKDRGTANEKAYRLYLEGVYHYDLRTREGAEKAVAALTLAVELDPNYARAWAGKAHAHGAAVGFGRNANRDHDTLSLQSIERALAIEDGIAEAHSALCLRTLNVDYDLAQAESQCKKAIELDPTSGIAHQVYSRLLNARGRHDEAIAEIKIAIDLEPTAAFNHRLLGVAYYYARRFDEAIAVFERVLTMDKSGPTIMWLTQALAHAGREKEAYELWMGRFTEAADADRRIWREAYEREGWKGIIRERARRFEESNEQYFHGAAYHAYIGDSAKAFEYLERSIEERGVLLPYLEVDPRFDNIRSDPRYKAFLKRIVR